MTSEHEAAQAVVQFVQRLWPSDDLDGDLTLCTTNDDGRFALWRRTKPHLVESWALDAVQRGHASNVWLGVCLQQPGNPGRGGSETALWAPGLWAEVDYGKRGAPPDEETAWEILRGLNLPPSLAVHSGSGVHAYWLFKEPVDLRAPGAREAVEKALLGLNRKLRQVATEAGGWGVDKVADLARVLRLPGTLNFKYDGTPPVRLMSRPEIVSGSYEATELIPWAAQLAGDEQGRRRDLYGASEYSRDEDFPDPAAWDAIVAESGCSWAREAVDAVKWEGSEPTWYALLSIASRSRSEELGAEGEHLAQVLSAGHPRYSPEETREKVLQSIESSGPRLCASVHDDLGWNGCETCPWTGRIKSPIAIGRQQVAELGENDEEVDPNDEFARMALETYPPTEKGLAWRFVNHFGDLMRYVNDSEWWVWEGSVWRRDNGNARMLNLAQRVSSIAQADAQLLVKGGGDDDEGAGVGRMRAQALAGAARNLHRLARTNAMIGWAKAVRSTWASSEDFDAHVHLLNCANGVVNLETGELLPHAPELLLTRQVTAPFDKDAVSPTWERFVEQVMPDPEERRALQQLAGYTLSGEAGERIAMFLYGVGDNGKSVFADTLLQLLKGRSFSTGYAQQAPEGFLARGKPASDRIPADLAMMRSARMVLVSELPTRLELASEFIKWVTGEGEVTARFMRENHFTFKARFKLWVETNSRPKVKDNSNATWKRVLLIPFRQEFERVSGFKEELQAQVLEHEASGMLAWAWRGYLDWKENGRVVPDAWSVEREEMRNDEDLFRRFLSDCCTLGAEAVVGTSELHKVFKAWFAEAGEGPGVAWSSSAFNTAARDAGFMYGRTKKLNGEPVNNLRVWRGLTLNDRGIELLKGIDVVEAARQVLTTWQ